MISFFEKNLAYIKFYLFNKISSKEKIFNLKIDISKINYFIKLKDTLDRNNFIWFGDWDKQILDLSKYRNYSPSYNSIYQIYRENIKFNHCQEYLIKAKLLDNGQVTARAKNISELNNYFIQLNELKLNLEKFGYKSQLDLNNDRNKKNDEVGVVIDRHGRIIKLEDKFGGTHRFALCKVLGIKKIIISVKAIHNSLLQKDEIKKILSNKGKNYLIDKITNIIK